MGRTCRGGALTPTLASRAPSPLCWGSACRHLQATATLALGLPGGIWRNVGGCACLTGQRAVGPSAKEPDHWRRPAGPMWAPPVPLPCCSKDPMSPYPRLWTWRGVDAPCRMLLPLPGKAAHASVQATALAQPWMPLKVVYFFNITIEWTLHTLAQGGHTCVLALVWGDRIEG